MTKVSAIFWHWTANMRHSLQTSFSDDDHEYKDSDDDDNDDKKG